MSNLIRLAESYPSRYGAPVISRVDAAIFRRTYFTHCLQCSFCKDWCCQFGVDVDMLHYRAILEHAASLEARLGIPRDRWFTGEYEDDPEVPGGGTMRTRAVDGACVFLNRSGRGCLLHAYCLEQGIDHRELKSMVDCLFPLTFYDGVLCPADEVDDNSLMCLDRGPSLYRGLRDDVGYYWGESFVEELDRIETDVQSR